MEPLEFQLGHVGHHWDKIHDRNQKQLMKRGICLVQGQGTQASIAEKVQWLSGLVWVQN